MNCKNELLKFDLEEISNSKIERNKVFYQESLSQTYSVSLFFDEKSTAELLDFILQVAQITKNDYVVKNNIPPHITLGMFKAAKNQEGQLVEIIQKFNSEFQPIFEKKENVLCFEKLDILKNKIAFLSFAANQSIIYELNQKLHNSFLPDFPAACNNLYLPQVFFPHCTVATGLSKTHLALLQDVQNKNQIKIPKFVHVSKISLAIRHPYQELY